MFELLFLLLIGHVLADYPLQGDFLAKGKNHKAPVPTIPWWQCLTAHSLIHGGFVYLISGYFILGILEVVAHWIIDFLKCNNSISFNTDQALHITCKVIWVLVIINI